MVNHKWVKVELRDGGTQPGDENRIIWFTIGSVDTFERNLVRIFFFFQIISSYMIYQIYERNQSSIHY